MKGAVRTSRILKAAGLVSLGLLLLIAPACTKKPPTPPPAEEKPAPTPTPTPLPQETVTEAAPPAVVEPTEKAEDLDDVMRRQNQNKEFLKTVYFDFDKSEIRDDQAAVLKSNADWMKTNAKFKVLIEGHCDERGTIDYNLALGEKRAGRVKQYLADLGIPGDRMRTISYGKERPADPGHDEAAWAKNRRAEFVLEK